jgi:signal peptidase I
VTIVLVVALGLAAVGAALRMTRRSWLVVTVRGTSMIPTLRDGQRLIARRGAGYATGDIVVFRIAEHCTPDGAGVPLLRIKRVAAVGGEPVPRWLQAGEFTEPGHVPPHHIVVSGDNARSEDSRHLGFVSGRAILGVVRLPTRAAIRDGEPGEALDR